MPACIRSMTAVFASVLVAACGSGGAGVNSGGSMPSTGVPMPTPTPMPTATPAPTPTPSSSADTAEYRASAAAVSARAAYAFDRGITGKGVTIAIVDSGINITTPEFAGRISGDSTGFEQRIARCGTCPSEILPPFPIRDLDGHGTEVASIAAASRDGSGILGVAPDATILTLKVTGPDLENVTAGSTTAIPESLNPNGGLIAPAIRYALEKGAFVISMSLNGSGNAQLASEQRTAMNAVRAADRLVVESVSNDTGKDSFAAEFAENLVGSDRTNADWFLFAIGVTEAGTPRTANGNAGVLVDRTLSAAGVNVRVVSKDGTFDTVTGNSFAAPAIAGAAALLKQRWPQLGGKAISRILLDTATDLGAPGVDPIYGVGLLNVEKAMQAQASPTSFSTATAVLARYSSLTVSAPFGGTATAATMGSLTSAMTVFDRYGRDYAMAAPSGVRARSSGLLAGAFVGSTDPALLRPASTLDRRLGVASLSTVGPWQGASWGRPAVATFSPAPGQSVILSANVAVGGTGAASLSGPTLRGAIGQTTGTSLAWTMNGWSTAYSFGSSMRSRSTSFRNRDAALRTFGLSTPLGVGLEVSDLVEQGQVLGFTGDMSLGLAGARTLLTTATIRRSLAGLMLSGRATIGSTHADRGAGPIRFANRLVSSAFSFDAVRSLFGGWASFGVASPLRVERARASVLVPISYDLATGDLTEERRSFDVSPRARELDLELGWTAALSPSSSLRVGVARAFDAGHVHGALDTAGFVTFAIR